MNDKIYKVLGKVCHIRLQLKFHHFFRIVRLINDLEFEPLPATAIRQQLILVI